MQSTSPRFAADITATAREHLEQLVTANPGILLAVLTSGDGFEIAAHPLRPVSQRIAAMSSSLQALSEAMAQEAGLANSRNLIIESDSGTIVVLGLATLRMSLAVVGSGNEILGRLLWTSRNCCAALERSLQR